MARRIQVAAISVVVFGLPLVMWPGLTDYNYAKCIVGLIAIAILLVLWGVDAWVQTPWTIRVPWCLVPILGLVAAGALSAAQATNGLIVAQSLILLVAFILLLWMIANVVRDHRDVRWVLIALLASGSLAAIYGILQYAGIVSGSPGRTGVNAIISTMGNRNHLGGFLLYLFYPSIILLLHLKTQWMKALMLVLSALCFAVMLLVHQSGTQIVFALVSAALVLSWMIFRPARCSGTNRWWLVALVSVILTLWIGSAIFPPQRETQAAPTQVARATSITNIASGTSWLERMWYTNSGEEREWFWWIGAEMFADHPVTGIGLGNYKINYATYEAAFAATHRGQDYDISVDRVSQAHNEFVQVGAELGSVGLLLLLCSLAALATSVWIRLRRINRHNRLDLILLAMGILAILTHSLVSFPAHVASSSLELAVFCGLVLSLRFGESISFAWTLKGWTAKTAHGLVIAAAVIITVFAVSDLRANWLMERGISHIQAGAFALGETTLQRSLKLDFAPRQTYYYLAIAQIRLGKLDGAEENLEKCMTRFLDRSVMLTYADLELNLGELEKAQTAVDVVLATHAQPAVERQARYIEGVIAVRQQDIDRAIQLFEKLTADHPKYEMGFVALGQIYAAMGQPSFAQESFQMAHQLIEETLSSARDQLETMDPSSPSAEAQIQTQIELLTQQKAYVIDQLDQLPEGF